ncbi:hypothetical protein GC105_11580 [Alkalibaculum sp. M08DMB]|uniref:Uncharacterized protein n=1 Tax=Alkalibaculum sporogenes TaxID=2655001 RepID=A0A6A7KAA6_9FIRM|nr:hypothetical protein [Alkalibaculum sporogenes]MPW26430.1 hypothetical protein [Alkalibaculum sporogenes]
MEDKMKIFQINNFDSSITSSIVDELQIYSNYEVKCEKNGNKVLQKFYVPKLEYEFYQRWKELMVNNLLNSNHVVLVENIARRHKLKLQR